MKKLFIFIAALLLIYSPAEAWTVFNQAQTNPIATNIQAVPATSLLGNPTGSAAAASAVTLGKGLAFSSTTAISNAENTVTFQPGLAAVVSNVKTAFALIPVASTVDNMIVSASNFTCSGNPTITMYECGTSTTCASSPTTIASVTLTAGGTAMPATISSSAIAAGDYIAFAISAGTCSSLDINAQAQIHSN